jgi:hypothetical protein
VPAPAIFGITDDTVNTVVNLLMLFLVVLWLALVFYTYTDAKRRIADPMLVGCATAASLFPFVGTIVYLILRPPEFLDDVRERELEIAASEARLLQLHETTCPHCAYPVEKSFLRCPNCRKRLKEPCATCRKPLDPRWSICPYCEAEVGQAPPRRRRTAAERARPRPERAVPAEQPAADRLTAGGRSPSRAPSRAAEGRPRPTAADGDYPGRSPAPADAPPALDQPTTRPRTPG